MDTQSKQVFISYHTETGKDAVRKICAALEGAGVGRADNGRKVCGGNVH